MKNYHPEEIEPKWLKRWEKEGIYRTPKKGKKFYCLDMFPYPSGVGLHVGHVRIYTASDVVSRYLRMKGYQVLHPMGWDAFGLPAENDALKKKVNPNKLVPNNIATFKRQMKMMGFSYDWEREVDTSQVSYYRWTQWLFLKLYEMGLLYRKNVPINWCPFCKTGLANEEVLPGGTHERCGQPVTKKDLPQWLFKITDYADRLLEDLAGLDWPEGILEMQRNWIGRSEGATIKFQIPTPKGGQTNPKFQIEVFTTRPDTLFGATAMVLAPEHSLVGEILKGSLQPQDTPEVARESLNFKPKIQNQAILADSESQVRKKTTVSSSSDGGEIKKAIHAYVKAAKQKSELERTELQKEKTGVPTGIYCINSVNNKTIPIWIADYVIATYGGGAVMLVPAHDERDWQFAKKYGLEIIPVIKPKKGKWDYKKSAFTEIDKAEVFNSDFLNGLAPPQAKEKMIDYLVKKKWGKRAVNYHLRDWVFSRQRYWGEPIPLLYCSQCGDENGVVPVPYQDLPVELPYVEKYEPTGTGQSPLAAVKEWIEVKCPQCGDPARRETDTMPNWAGSCWYFLRFTDAENTQAAFGKKEVNYWGPVDWYLGGAEHAVLHLLYSRFWVKAFCDAGLLSFKEPFLKLSSVGMVLAEDGRKMSKSLGNVINPDDVAAKFGADTVRVYEMFMAPFSQAVNWSTKGVLGAHRFLTRIWRLYHAVGKIVKERSGSGGHLGRAEASARGVRLIPTEVSGGSHHSSEVGNVELKFQLHRLIKKAGEDIEKVKFNTTVAAMMEFLNSWSEEEKALSRSDAGIFLQLLAPFAPFITEELWDWLSKKDTPLPRTVLGKSSIHHQPWPKYDPELVKEEEVTMVVQVNGKVRGQLKMKNEKLKMKNEVEKLAKKEPNVARHLKGKKIEKVVFVSGRLINFVI